jgi:parvulin-like peptidyl-prolyl isomerase
MGTWKEVFRIQWILRTVLGVALLSASCSVGPVMEPDPVERVAIAEVDGELVYQDQLEAFVSYTAEDSVEEHSADELLSRFLVETVLFRAAEKAGVSLSEEEAEGVTQNWRVDERGLLEEEFLGRSQRYLTIQKFLQQSLGAAADVEYRKLRDYYVRHMDEFVVEERLRILEVLLEDRKLAEEIRDELEPGNFRQFREIARVYSVGVSAESDGDLGVFQKGELPERFEEAIFKLKIGEISPVFQSELGAHLFTVEERIPKHAQKFWEVQDVIFERLVSEKEREALGNFVNEKLRQAVVFVFQDGAKRRWSLKNAP